MEDWVWRRNRAGEGILEIDCLLGQRAVEEWLLLAFGRCHHFIADVSKKKLQFKTGSFDVL